MMNTGDLAKITYPVRVWSFSSLEDLGTDDETTRFCDKVMPNEVVLILCNERKNKEYKILSARGRVGWITSDIVECIITHKCSQTLNPVT